MNLDQVFEWQGRRIAWGRQGSGPAVVFGHGTPFSSLLWQPMAEALARDFTVHLWDMPGYGRSSKEAGHAVDFGTQAQALAALIQHWRLERPHVVAHDIGGAVALRAHLVDGAAYASLLLVDVVAIPPVGSAFFRFVQAHPDVLGQLPGYIHQAIVRAYIGNASLRPLPDDVLDALLEPWTGAEGQTAFYRQIADFDDTYLAQNQEVLDRLAIPVHIVWGERDAWIPVEVAHRLHAAIPGSTLAVVPGSSHLMHYDQPAALMDAVRVWLDAQSDRHDAVTVRPPGGSDR